MSYNDINTTFGTPITKAPTWTPFLNNLADTITYSITNAPTGVTIDPVSGAVNVSNTVTVGTYSAIVTATGSGSCTGTDSTTITINVANDVDTSAGTVIPLTPAEVGGDNVGYEIAPLSIGDSTNANYNYVAPIINISTGEVSIEENTSPGVYRITGTSDSNTAEAIFFITVAVADKEELLNELNAGIANFGDTANFNYIKTGAVTDMSSLFFNNATFNGNISAWDVSSVTNMSKMFQEALAFNQDIGNWDVSQVSDMSSMFKSNPSTYLPNITNAFNGDISEWDVSNVTNMSEMFFHTVTFNGDLSRWKVHNVTDMSYMFGGYLHHTFNQDISGWVVSSVTNMEGMFFYNEAFNRDLNTWDVSGVYWAPFMFDSATTFNQDLEEWKDHWTLDENGKAAFSTINVIHMFTNSGVINGIGTVDDVDYVAPVGVPSWYLY